MQENPDFRFKQFSLRHDKCAMKVGTDGILLGAWIAPTEQASSCLDMGCGSGLIALMLAQRTAPHCRITAVEIDAAAMAQAQENFRHSPWSDKLRIYREDVLEFLTRSRQQFDIIAANPPYFEAAISCSNPARNQARYFAEQTHQDWLQNAAQCLSEQGQIHFILPFTAGKILQQQTDLYCLRACEVITKQGKPPHRLLLSFGRKKSPTELSRLVIYNAENQYTPDFIRLTRDFYLKF
ncbi:tRNA1Val (adenine37-N6)-methyltransferase [Mesocricetibacter intestinalis]|uniref:tRNA1(Val) (adenine(37)-N6)-methyltransferase n=1 Tax=Mesocricetibacter intestinalis TaxID=1521930 RepID=A0A4R6VEW6_9PAST|nr:methyltransferase [Mesocricetibacter intestinalis]TDQ59392.1 tRNA1Val (adenine37-N6)-methyltransferase [Mesocricetibacter intestinalis]